MIYGNTMASVYDALNDGINHCKWADFLCEAFEKYSDISAKKICELACGTGSASTAVTLWAREKLPGGKLTVKNKGGDLTVAVEGKNGIVSALYLEGPTEVVKIFEL